MKSQFNVTGMTCSACSAHVEKAVSKMNGVTAVSVNLVSELMTVEYDENSVSIQDIIKEVVKSGYGATLINDKQAQTNTEKQQIIIKSESGISHKTRLIVSIVFSVLLMYVSMGSMIGLPLPALLSGVNNAVSFALVQFILSLPVIYVNMTFFVSGYKKLFVGAPNMDTLVAVGCSASMLYGIFAMFRMSYGLGSGDMELVHTYYHQLYFESATMILTLILVGKTLESSSKKRTGQALNKLRNLAPKTAILWSIEGEKTVDTAELKVGDTVMIKAGMSIPQDGKVIMGHCFVNESAMSGESIPVEKSAGSSVIGGTIIESGFCVAQITAVGEESLLSKIVTMVEQANAVKPPIAKLADKISGIFVPVVMGIALVTLIVWLAVGQTFEFALRCAVSVLVISCPCALGLATPLAVMVGTGKGAENGVLFKSGDALQQLSAVKHVVLDKTGTITEGKPQVVDIIACNIDNNELISIVAGIEKLSEHPLGRAVVQYAQQNNIEFAIATQYSTLIGKGVSATVDGKQYFVGNEKLMQECGVQNEAYADILQQTSSKGSTPLMLASEGKFLGLIAVADKIKQSSIEGVKQLKKMGIKVAMLTGDNQLTAQAIAQQVGIDSVYSQLMPDDKQKIIEQLKQQHKVAMVGDGINDAPALTTADVGIAIGCGSDIAIDSADVVLVNNSISDVSYAIALSKATLLNIKENLFWAFAYNTLGIPLASGVLYPTVWQLTLTPMIGALAMSLSSLFVVGNALRLKLFRRKDKTKKSGNKKELLNEQVK